VSDGVDQSPNCFEQVPGGPELRKWFGGIPSFHDAEILSLYLDRAGSSRIRIHTWRMTDAVDENGFYVLENHAVVTFILDEVIDLELSEFNPQNVIYGLTLRQTPDGLELALEHCWGLSGRLVARQIRVEFQPGKPEPTTRGSLGAGR
jgi:hypothetical protein